MKFSFFEFIFYTSPLQVFNNRKLFQIKIVLSFQEEIYKITELISQNSMITKSVFSHSKINFANHVRIKTTAYCGPIMNMARQ